MKRSNLAVAVILLYSSAMLAQHSSGGGGGGGGSSSSSGGGGSHASSSGGSSSSGSSGSHSSGGSGSSGGSHVSGGTGAHGSGSSGGSVSRGGGMGTASFTRSNSELFRAGGMPAFSSKTVPLTLDKEAGQQIQQMVSTGKSLEEIRQFVHTKTGVDPDTRPIRIETNAKRSLFSTLRHPLQKPRTAIVADLRHPVCTKASCRVCPAGSAANGSGGCTGPRTNLCASGTYWFSNGCQVLGQAGLFYGCRYDTVSGQGSSRLELQRMQKALAERDAACSQDPAGQECSEKNVLYQRAVADYNVASRGQKSSFQRCMQGSAFGFFDPIS